MSVPRFQAYDPEQMLLLPPRMRDWLPDDHLALFVLDVVAELDLSAMVSRYDGSRGGRPPFSPRMLVGLLVYGYCIGVCSSRKLEQATYEQVAFRVLTADQHPDHDTIAHFRREHLAALAELFVQVLRLCEGAGLVKLGHVALDGTKMKANASKHKAMSYGRMDAKVEELEAQIRELMDQAEQADRAEDERYGKGVRGDELPEELRRREDRLAKIKQAKAVLEAEAKERAQAEQTRRDEMNAAREARGHKPVEHAQPPDEEPESKAQRNFTDSESRIMKDSATGGWVQGYNAQAAVDEASQIIVAADVTQEANDKRQLEPMVEQVKGNTNATPKVLSADNGYYSESNVEYLQREGIDGHIATGRSKHGESPPPPPRGRIPKSATPRERMERKLRTKRGRATYARRKAIVEPVFGQIKACRGIRGFLLRGLDAVRAEWRLICAAGNLLKLFRSGRGGFAATC